MYETQELLERADYFIDSLDEGLGHVLKGVARTLRTDVRHLWNIRKLKRLRKKQSKKQWQKYMLGNQPPTKSSPGVTRSELRMYMGNYRLDKRGNLQRRGRGRRNTD